MAKKTIWQRIKGWFTGEDKKKKKATPPATRVTMNEVRAQSNSPRRAYIDTIRGKDVKDEMRSLNSAYKAKKREYADITKSIDEKLHLTDSGKKQTEYYKNQGSKVNTYQNTKTVKYEPPQVKKAKQNVEAANEAGRSQTEYYKSQGSKANTYQNVKTKKYTPPEPTSKPIAVSPQEAKRLSSLEFKEWWDKVKTMPMDELFGYGTSNISDNELYKAFGGESADEKVKSGLWERTSAPYDPFLSGYDDLTQRTKQGYDELFSNELVRRLYSLGHGFFSKGYTLDTAEAAQKYLTPYMAEHYDKYGVMANNALKYQSYEENKNQGWETAGEILGTLASFGGSFGAYEKAVTKAGGKLFPKAAEKLAEKKLFKALGKKGAEKAFGKRLAEVTSKEFAEKVIEDNARKIALKKAEQVLGVTVADLLQDATMGTIYDVTKASESYEPFTNEWWKEVKKNKKASVFFNSIFALGRIGKGVTPKELAAISRAELAAKKGAGKAVAENADEIVENLRPQTIEDTLVNDTPELVRNADEAVDGVRPQTIEDTLINEPPTPTKAIEDTLINEPPASAVDDVVSTATKDADEVAEVASKNAVDEDAAAAFRKKRPKTYKKIIEQHKPNVVEVYDADKTGQWVLYKDRTGELCVGNPIMEHGSVRVGDGFQSNGDYFGKFTPENFARAKRAFDDGNLTPFVSKAKKAAENLPSKVDDTVETLAKNADETAEATVKSADKEAARVAEATPDVASNKKSVEPPDVLKKKKPKPLQEQNEYRIEVTLEGGKKRRIKVKAENPSEALRKASKRKGVKRAAYLETLNENAVDNTNSRVFKAADNADSRAAKSVDDFAGVDEDVAAKGFNPSNDARAELQATAEKEAENATLGKSKFEQMRNEAYAEAGTTLNTDGVERMTAAEQRTLLDANWRTTEEHTKKGFSTIAITGDRGYKGVAYNALKNGDTVKNVYHDKDYFGESAQRIMKIADEEGGIKRLTEDYFERWARGDLKLTTDEARLMPYDCITAVDFANANRFIKGTQTLDPQMERLYLAACKAYGEQASVGGLSLRLSHKILMSSPDYRGKAVRDQIVDMFNRSAGMRKMLGKGKGDKILNADELDEILKNNPALKDVLDRLKNLDAATSADDVEKLASEALLQARKVMPMTVFDQLTQWRYVAMLSSPKTHIRNVTSNIYSATLGQARDAIASQAQKNLVNGRWGKYSKMYKEAVASGKINESEYFRSAGGLSMKVYKNSHIGVASGFKYNKITSQIDRLNLELKATKDAKAVERITSRLTKLEEAQKVAKKEFDDAIAKIESPTARRAWKFWNEMGKDELVANAEKFERRLYNGTVSKGIWKVNDKASAFVGEALETADALSLERIAREKYEKILLANGWEDLSILAKNGDANAAKRLKLLEEYAAQEASYTAARDTYRNYNKLSQALNKFVADSLFNYDAPAWKKGVGLLAHATFPFTKVPVNLMTRSFDYSPIGLIRAKKALAKAIDAGDVTEINRAVERVAEGRIGMGIAMLGVGLGFADPDGDLIVGRLNDTDYIDRKKKDAGYQNYSANINGTSVSLDWTTPTSCTFFVSTEVGRMMRHIFDAVGSENGLKFDFWEAFDVPMMLMSTTIEPLLQLGMFQGVNDTIESVVKSDNYDDSGTNIHPAIKIVKSILTNYANSMLTPAALKSLNRAFSPYDYFVVGDTDSEYAFYQQASKVPFLSDALLGAKTNSWGEIKNEKKTAGDYLKAVAKEFSPATLNKVTWDDTDKYLAEFYRQTGYQDAFPKNNYDSTVEVGRISGAHDIEMSPKEMAEYNVQRGKAGGEAMEAVLNTVVFNRYSKDDKGHLTIADPNNMSEAEKKALIKQFEGKGIKEVVAWVIKQPAFKNATVAEQKQVLAAIYGTNGSGDNKAVGARLASQKYIAQKHGMAAEEYDYYNEVPRRVQESLQPYINSGLITYQQAVDFCRNAGKTTYSTDEDGEAGGSVTTRYGKQSMSEYLASAGLTEEQNAALYNAFKTSGKDYSGIDLSSGTGRRRRGYGYGGYRRRGGGGGRKLKVPALKKSNYKASSKTYKDIASTLKTRSSSIGAPSLQNVKVEPPKVKFKKYEV